MARMKLYALNKDKKMSVLDKIETKVVLLFFKSDVVLWGQCFL